METKKLRQIRFDSFDNRVDNAGAFKSLHYSLNPQLNLLEDLEGSLVRATYHQSYIHISHGTALKVA